MGAKGVQFRGIVAVMEVYDNLKIIAWAIACDKNINMKFHGNTWEESREALNTFLTQLEKSGTSSVYTLHLYEDLPKGAKIRLSLEPDYSFNFVVLSDEDSRGVYGGRNTAINSLLDKVTSLEAKLAAREAELEEEDDEEPGGIGAVINGILSDPSVKEWIRTKAIGLADKLISGTPASTAPANVIPMNSQPAKIGEVSAEDPVLINQDQAAKIQQALEILARVDPKLGDNLLKLAKIAENEL